MQLGKQELTCKDFQLNGAEGITSYNGDDIQNRPLVSAQTPPSGDMICSSLTVRGQVIYNYVSASTSHKGKK